jgi:nitrite reductase/ring-hydroxylating ferredoxin subunit
MGAIERENRRAAAGDHALCATDSVPPGEARRVLVGARVLAIFNLDGTFYVTDDTCTHGFASLAEGFLTKEGTVECAWHGGAFDIRTGAAVTAPCQIPLVTHAVSVRDGMVWVVLTDKQAAEG